MPTSRKATPPKSAPRKRAAAAPAEPSRADFVFTHNGADYTLPSFAMLKSGLIRRIRSMDEADAFYALLEEVASPETLAAVDDMAMLDLRAMVNDWQKHSGVRLGE
jgi:hypothetical protein